MATQEQNDKITYILTNITCPDCGVKAGELHEYNCLREECPFCADNVIVESGSLIHGCLLKIQCCSCFSDLADEDDELFEELLKKKGRIPFRFSSLWCDWCKKPCNLFLVPNNEWLSTVGIEHSNDVICQRCYNEKKIEHDNILVIAKLKAQIKAIDDLDININHKRYLAKVKECEERKRHHILEEDSDDDETTQQTKPFELYHLFDHMIHAYDDIGDLLLEYNQFLNLTTMKDRNYWDSQAVRENNQRKQIKQLFLSAIALKQYELSRKNYNIYVSYKTMTSIANDIQLSRDVINNIMEYV